MKPLNKKHVSLNGSTMSAPPILSSQPKEVMEFDFSQSWDDMHPSKIKLKYKDG